MLHRVLCVVCVPAAAAAAQPLVSNFELSREGWTVQTRTVPTGAFTLVSTFSADLIAQGGDAGGYIEELDPDSNWSFFASPDAWAGDRSSALGRPLSYSIRTNVTDYPDGRLVVLLGAGAAKISCATQPPAIGVWVRRSLPLTQGTWRVGSAGTGAVATTAQISAVLTSLSRVLIGMEYGGDVLQERVGLDSVSLGSCPADFDADGTVDFFDYDAFVQCFEGASCPPGTSADFDGDGTVDFFDYDAFVVSFETGC